MDHHMFSVKLGNVAPLSDGGATSTPKEPLALLFPILPGGSRSRGVQRAASSAGSEFAHPRLRLQQRLLRSKDGNEKILASRFRYRTSCCIKQHLSNRGRQYRKLDLCLW